MLKQSIIGNIDVAQVTLYMFWIFFAGLIYYLQAEGKREGYPLEPDRPSRVTYEGFPPIPSPKTFILPHGGTKLAPVAERDMRPLMARPIEPWPGAPLAPTGNPMRDGVGPAAWAERSDAPDLTVEGHPRIVPLREAAGYSIERRDPDPRGMTVIGADGEKAGTVSDAWIDHSECLIRYLEITLADSSVVLLPMTFARINGWRRTVKVRSILASQFSGVPRLQNPVQISRREEDQISAYYGGGLLYATPERAEPII